MQSPDFWVLVAALKRFIEREGQGQLPLEVRCCCAAPAALVPAAPYATDVLHPAAPACALSAVHLPSVAAHACHPLLHLLLILPPRLAWLILQGSIPDMHASTQQYLELQRVYRARADAGALLDYLIIHGA